MKPLIGVIVLIIILWGVKKIYTYQLIKNSCFDNIDNQEFKDKMADKENVVVLDVRSLTEFKGGNIDNALNIDVLKGDFKEKVAKLDKEKTYLVYCRSGNRSMSASSILCDLGFEKIYNLSNGYSAWK